MRIDARASASLKAPTTRSSGHRVLPRTMAIRSKPAHRHIAERERRRIDTRYGGRTSSTPGVRSV
jgi:hypothetical protein